MDPMWIVLGLLVLLVLAYILLFNRLNQLRVKVDEGSSGIDVALEKRYDLLTEEIEAVKKYLSHEYQIMMDLTAVRTGTALDTQRQLQQQSLSEEALRTIDQEIARQSEKLERVRVQMHESSPRRTGGQRGASAGAQRQMHVNQKIGVLTSVHRDLAGVGAGVNALMEQYPTLYSSVSMEYFQRTIFDAEEHLQAARRLYNANVSLYNQTLASIPWSLVAALCRMEPADFYEIEEHKKNFKVSFD